MRRSSTSGSRSSLRCPLTSCCWIQPGQRGFSRGGLLAHPSPSGSAPLPFTLRLALEPPAPVPFKFRLIIFCVLCEGRRFRASSAWGGCTPSTPSTTSPVSAASWRRPIRCGLRRHDRTPPAPRHRSSNDLSGGFGSDAAVSVSLARSRLFCGRAVAHSSSALHLRVDLASLDLAWRPSAQGSFSADL